MRAILLYLVVYSGMVNAQQSVLSKIPPAGKTIQAFIPKGYDTIATTTGDLNKDGREDIVLCMRYNGEDSFDIDEEPQRLLIILFKQNEVYKVGGKSAEVLMCRHCGGMYGDPYSGVQINNGILQVHHYGGSAWRWVEHRKFRFQNGGFYLTGSTSDYFWNRQPCEGDMIGDAGRKYKDINFITGDEELIERDENCKLLKHQKIRLNKKPLLKLENFKYDYP
jgi:hypothetical protein